MKTKTLTHVLAAVGLWVPAVAGTGKLSPHVEGYIMNVGQWPSHVVAAARSGDVDVWVTRTGMAVDRHVRDRQTQTVQSHAVHVRYDAAKGDAHVATGDYVTTVTFIKGNRPDQWFSAPVVASLRIEGLVHGATAVYTLDKQRIRYDLELESPQVLNRLKTTVAGATVRVAEGGQSVQFAEAGITLSDLHVFQGGKPLQAEFVSSPHGVAASLSYTVSGAHPTLPLVVDPVVYGSYVGGAQNDSLVGIVKSVGGDLAVAGTTLELAYPAVPGYRSQSGGGLDGFVAVFDAQLTRMKAFTFIGGAGDDRIRGVASDAEGAIVVGGSTTSADYPVSTGAAGQIPRGLVDGFVSKLSPSIQALQASSFIAGDQDDIVNSVAIDSEGNLYAAGQTRSTRNFPTTNGLIRTAGGNLDGFLTKLSPNGSAYFYSTYLGRAADDAATFVTVDATGSPYVTGWTRGTDFPTAPTPSGMGQQQRRPYDRTHNGGVDAFVVKLGTDGGSYVYSTFWGGSGDDFGRGIVVDELGRAHVVMTTNSPNIEVANGFGTLPIGGNDGVIGTFAASGRDLDAAAYFGGTGDDQILFMAPASASNFLVLGSTTSSNFPATSPGTTSEKRGSTDGFIAILSPAAIKQSTLVPSQGDEQFTGGFVDASGDVHFAANTVNGTMPVSENSFDSTRASGQDGWVGKYAWGTMELASPAGGESWCAGSNQTVSWAVDEMLPTDTFTVQISEDGITWTNLSAPSTSRSYVWRLANLAVNSYHLRVLSSRGHVSRTTTPITITRPPTIDEQPVGSVSCSGESVRLTVVARGNNLRYQWRRGGQNIPNATSSVLDIPSVSAANAGRYDCVVTGSCSPNATTVAVDVVVGTTTAITGQPSDVTVDEGATAEFTVAASGSGLSYQWYRGAAELANANEATLRLIGVDTTASGLYSCEVRGACGTVRSEGATLNVRRVVNSVAASNTLRGVRVLGPMPASNGITVAYDGNAPFLNVRILDLSGAVVSQGSHPAAQQITVDCSMLPSATYVLELEAHGASYRMLLPVSR